MPTTEKVSDELSPDRFEVHHADLRGTRIAFVHEGRGGLPLLLVHGWPETKRIWWRNIARLADAGFEVIVPDLRGFGDSGPATDGAYDVASSSEDLRALVADVLGHRRCTACGGDYGGVVLQDLSLRYPGFVARLLLFNTIPPILEYERAGVRPIAFIEHDHFRRHGVHPDELLARLNSRSRRIDYVSSFYRDGGWAGAGAFTPEALRFMSEPFAEEEALRRSLVLCAYAFGREPSAPPLRFESNPTETLVLYGPEDPVVPPAFVDCMTIAFPAVVGPFVALGAGHFLQWERADLMNRTLVWFCRDLRPAPPLEPTPTPELGKYASMSAKKNIEVVRKIFRAIEERDSARLPELFHPEIEFHWPPSLPYGRNLHGRAGEGPTWAETWLPLQPTDVERRMDPRVVAASDEEVVVLWRQRGVTATGDRFDGPVLGLYLLREGKLTCAQMFHFDTAELCSFLAKASV